MTKKRCQENISHSLAKGKLWRKRGGGENMKFSNQLGDAMTTFICFTI